MQATTEAPQPVVAPAPTAVTTTAEGKTIPLSIPQSETDVQALHARRQDLRDEISSSAARRQNIVEQLRSAPEGISRTGLEQRVALIDKNIMGMENEVTAIDAQLSAAPAELVQISESANRNYDNGFEEGMASGVALIGVPLALLLAYRWFRRRRNKKRGVTAEIPADAPRLERLEHGMDAIAIEIERISEGQRFLTKLLSESADSRADALRIAQPAAEARR